MMLQIAIPALCLALSLPGVEASSATPYVDQSGQTAETRQQHDERMRWWREARFGMFIHWGLYAIPAGEWKGQTHHGEWIMHTAQIAIERYEQLRDQFNPTAFDADEWVRIAKEAGMRYVVITSKHHDGFCLFDSAHTDYDITSTPFQRDIMKELADACRRGGLKMCWYHSIMDWHHPDYLPRRDWDNRPDEGADFDRFREYLKGQVRELLTSYGPIGVMWFDGQWEGTWRHEHGIDLYSFCRNLQPNLIINDRVDKGGGGLALYEKETRFAGDFSTPEQVIPDTRITDKDWETCMTLNNHWGYNKHDQNWKSTQDLIRKLVDIASKGGNFLLNVGPDAEGRIPQPCVERLHEIGRWMEVNGESIYGTQASPFRSIPWGRCTQESLPDGNSRLYLHVFDWPGDGRLVVRGIFNEPRQARLLADRARKPLRVTREEDALVVSVPASAVDSTDTVVMLDVVGRPDVADPPEIVSDCDIFVDQMEVRITSGRDRVQLRYTTNGSVPSLESPLVTGPLTIVDTAILRARAFRGERPVSGISEAIFTKVRPRPAVKAEGLTQGIRYAYFEGEWDQLPDFDRLEPVKSGKTEYFDFSPRDRAEYFGFRYEGFIKVPVDGVYRFSTISDDGSRLYIGEDLVVDNDGLHGMREAEGRIALAAGAHPLTVTFFEKTGGDGLEVFCAGPGMEKQPVPKEILMCRDRTDVQTKGPAISAEDLPRPTPQQLAWHDSEIGMFIHFAPNTWTDQEYDDLSLPLTKLNPSKLDTDQWAAAAEAMGAKYIVFVAKHAGGFCLWQTDTTDYSIRSTPWKDGKGNILAELAQSCRNRNIKLGVYVSPADRRHGAGLGGKCETAEEQEQYNRLYRRQLTEVLSRYGEMFEVWFDGSIVVPVGDILKMYAPGAMVFQGPHATIRWVGNEDGYAPYPAWNTVREEDARSGVATAAHGTPNGNAWLPLECDARIRSTWFWNTRNASTLKSVDELMEMYYRSVGHGAVLLLNHTPDTTGLIPEADFTRGAQFGTEVRRRFASSVAETSGRGESIELFLDAPATIDHVMIMEDIAFGERIRRYVVEAQNSTGWTEICSGTAIGHKKIDRFAPLTTARVRLRITSAVGEPLIRTLAIYYVGGPTPASKR
ncbi:MAG: alpha-L-fucosidase [Phycisphaerales bacterium]|nr:MAG: alpha-L-fucosidase [Phycisphaerales bacterium]